MNRVDEFAELIEWRCRFVEFRVAWIDAKKVSPCERRTIAAHTGESSRNRVDREELDDAEALLVQNNIQSFDKASERPRGRDDGPAALVKNLNARIFDIGFFSFAETTKLPRKSGIDGRTLKGPSGFGFDVNIGTIRPFSLAAVFWKKTGLRMKVADIDQRHPDPM